MPFFKFSFIFQPVLSGEKDCPWVSFTMVKSCCAIGCAYRFKKGDTKKPYRFPADQIRRDRWIAALRRAERDCGGSKLWKPSIHSYICSDHFVEGKHMVFVIHIVDVGRGTFRLTCAGMPSILHSTASMCLTYGFIECFYLNCDKIYHLHM